MNPALTKKQKTFLEYLQARIRDDGFAPSLREAAAAFEVSHAAIAQMLKALEEKGYIRREGRYSRSIELLKPVQERQLGLAGKEIPLVGEITAGLPMYAQEEYAGHLLVDATLFHSDNLFALKVRGDSMKNAGILNGDIAICEPRQFAADGEIVVALIGFEEASVKRFFRHDTQIELRPENEDYEPMFFDFSDILIQGRVVGIQRAL